MKKWIFSIVLLGLIIAIICCVPKKKTDIPNVGDSNIAFTITDYRHYDANYDKSDSKVIYEDQVGFPIYIVNPSPHKQEFQLTNVETGEVFTVKYRDNLQYDEYRIKVLSLDGDIISTHDLTIERSPNT